MTLRGGGERKSRGALSRNRIQHPGFDGGARVTGTARTRQPGHEGVGDELVRLGQ